MPCLLRICSRLRLPRACAQLFEGMALADSEVTFVVHVSFCEVYNNTVLDMLHSRSAQRQQRRAAGGK